MGGSTDVDAAFVKMCDLSGDGDFLILRATGTDAYNPYVRNLCPNGNSVATLIVPSRFAAADPFVVAAIDNAEAIFIAGGDQSNYIEYWSGTPLLLALSNAVNRSVPMGGTSAGLNVLSQFIYSAEASKGATSSEALANPFSRTMTFARDFTIVPTLLGIIADPHFAARDRMGRDLAFLCRIRYNGWATNPKGIAVDEETALWIDGAGNSEVLGSGNVYFLRAPGAPQVCAPRQPLTYLNISVYRIATGDTFNLTNWIGAGGTEYTVSATAGVLSSTQAGGSIY
jgi:cyanophycinase